MRHGIEFGPVWHVIVLTIDGRREDYWHRDRMDILQSIETTWAKVRDTIEIVETTSTVCVYQVSTGTDRGPLLLSAIQVNDLPVLDGPTHY